MQDSFGCLAPYRDRGIWRLRPGQYRSLSVRSDGLGSRGFRFPYVVLGWLVLAVLIIVAFPKLVRRIGENLSRAEGIERPPPPP